MGFQLKGLDHVQLAAPANCENEARNFFGEILDMEEIEKPDLLKVNGGVWFRIGNQEIHIGVEKDFTAAKKAHPAFYVEKIEQLQAQLTAFQIPIKKDDRLPGYNRFYVNDPFGNRLEFLEKQ